MIISHKHKFIFIKPQKTAGTSVELLLSRICGPDDVITPLGYDPNPNVRGENNAKAPQNYCRPKPFKEWEMRELYWFFRKGRKPNLNYREHLRAEKIKEYLGEDIWNEYLKISIVRNPWEHAVSMYKWMHHYNYENVRSDSFSLFLKNKYKLLHPFYFIRNQYCIDFMIRFENLDDSIHQLSKTIPLKSQYIPFTKKNPNKKELPISSWYDHDGKKLMVEMNQDLIEKFNYH